VLVAACSPEADQSAQEATETTSQEYASPAAAEALIAELADTYEEHYNLGHASKVSEMYAEDAVVLMSTSAIAEGREGIAAATELFMTVYSPQLTISPAAQLTVGDWVLDRGSYTNIITAEGEPATITGNYISLSSRGDYGLIMHRLAANFDSPPPIAMAAPEAMEAAPTNDGPLADFIASYMEHYNMGHASVVAEMWAEDGVAMFAERPAVMGRAGIEALFVELMETMSPQLTIFSTETEMIGDGVAVDRGSFKIDATIDGQSVTRNGTYLIVTKQADDGTWQIKWGLSNLAPMPSM
jgi:ketosteroid isomerase-like protein